MLTYTGMYSEKKMCSGTKSYRELQPEFMKDTSKVTDKVSGDVAFPKIKGRGK